ncbi:response regulator [Cohnella sp. AR92]|uniref:response regulator transcription factor n=1 Tax=Cohnella sp. AR92 TaxID=648716 RepID=UPI000F8EEC9D|nr:response regulator [Cohnella sp. AR92]RUS46105.1 response regulator [Cohnella sp. AR92]
MLPHTGTYRVMIVDDEAILRTGIVHLCNWSEYGIEIVAQAANGEEALQYMESARPHVVVTDIVMPVMDGVEFTKEMRKRYPEVKIVVLSSYSEYEYVREVFKFGVTDYLLKPKVSAPELIELIRTLGGEGGPDRQDRGKQEADPSLLLAEWLGGGKEKGDEKEYVRRLSPFFRSSHYRIVKASTGPALSRSKQTQSQLEQQLLGLAKKHMNGFDYACAFPENEILLLLNYHPDEVVRAITVLRQFTQEAKEALGSIVFVLSGAFEPLEQIAATNDRLTQCLGKLFYFPKQHCVTETKIRLESEPIPFDHAQFTASLRVVALDKAFAQLKALFVRMQSLQAYDEYSLKRFSQNIVYTALSNLEHLKLPITETSQARLKLFKTIDLALDLAELEEILTQFFAELESEAFRSQDQQQSFLLNKIYEYVNENYSNDISLADLAEQLHMNYSYLSTYFKQRTNENLTAYINRVRIEKAKELLPVSNLTISQISRLTGFSEHNYFSKVFKKMTGMTPVEFRNQILQ